MQAASADISVPFCLYAFVGMYAVRADFLRHSGLLPEKRVYHICALKANDISTFFCVSFPFSYSSFEKKKDGAAEAAPCRRKEEV